MINFTTRIYKIKIFCERQGEIPLYLLALLLLINARKNTAKKSEIKPGVKLEKIPDVKLLARH
jgi:hypothetical protein